MLNSFILSCMDFWRQINCSFVFTQVGFEFNEGMDSGFFNASIHGESQLIKDVKIPFPLRQFFPINFMNNPPFDFTTSFLMHKPKDTCVIGPGIQNLLIELLDSYPMYVTQLTTQNKDASS
jgi:hypothetical protein